MLMLDKFPNGNLGNQVRQDYYQSKIRKYRTMMCRVLWRLFTCQPVFQKTLRGWVTEPKGELGHRLGRRQDSAKSPPHPAEKQKYNFENTCVFGHVGKRGGLLLLTEELFVLVRGNVIRCDELTSEGQVKCAVILACTFFCRSVFTSKMASIL